MNHRRTQQGFTMVEVLVALLLTAIATSGLIALFTVESRAAGHARRSTEASMLAQDKLEALRTSAAASDSEVDIDVSGRNTGIYTRTWTVTPQAGWVDITVSVTWREESGADKVVTMSTRRNL